MIMLRELLLYEFSKIHALCYSQNYCQNEPLIHDCYIKVVD